MSAGHLAWRVLPGEFRPPRDEITEPLVRRDCLLRLPPEVRGSEMLLWLWFMVSAEVRASSG